VLKTLVACESCSRHIRTTESVCPFCGKARAASAPETLTPFRPVNRAAVFFFTATSLVACGKKDADKTDAAPEAAAASNTAVMAPPYGVPVIDTPPPPPPHDAGRFIPAPPYGVPIIRDKKNPKKPPPDFE
jgi:hypothetical protein